MGNFDSLFLVTVSLTTKVYFILCITDPGMARQNSLASAGANFTKPGAHNKVYLCMSAIGSTPSHLGAAVIYEWLPRPLPPSPASPMSVGPLLSANKVLLLRSPPPRKVICQSGPNKKGQGRERGRILKYDPSAAAPTHELLSLPFQFCSGNGKFKISCTGSSSHFRTLLPYSSTQPLPAQQPNHAP